MGDMSWLTGPFGGLMALAFGTGCAAGYGFAIKTAFKAARKRIDEMRDEARRERLDCDRRITALEAELRELRDILMGKSPLPRFIGEHLPPHHHQPADMDALLDRIDEGNERDDERIERRR